MLKPTLLATAALVLIFSGPALSHTAQQSPVVQAAPAPAAAGTASGHPVAAEGVFPARQMPNEWRGSKLVGASVYGPDDKSIGDINELIVGPKGQIRAVVIGVGGFLGIGEKNVAVPFEALHISRKPNTSSIARIAAGVSKDELKNAPRYVYLKANGANNTTASGTGATTNTRTPAQP